MSDMDMIEIRSLSKDYGGGKGIFDITLTIRKGEVYGYLGPNGAGKSTTMRHLMGFVRPQSGKAHIRGMDCWTDRSRIQSMMGYLPGEIAFPDDMTGSEYLKLIASMRKMKDMGYAKQLLDYFEINPDAGLKRMSKGMRQKIGIVAAFMDDPQILLLDEPTSGLDPLMQNRFVDLVEKAKAKGKTILLSSHIFEEVEKTCDRLGMIKNGRLIRQITAEELRNSQMKTYRIGLAGTADPAELKRTFPDGKYDEKKAEFVVSVTDSRINELIRTLSRYTVRFLQEEKHTLEEYFMKFYED